MLERFYYKNHLGEIIDFGSNGVYANASDLRDHAWSYTSKNDVITTFKRGVVKKSLPVIFCGKTGQACRTAANNAYIIAEKDVLAKEKGTIHVGDYYMNCWIYSITYSKYLQSERYLHAKIKICTDDPVWRTEKTLVYEPTYIDSSYGVDFPFDFPFDYQQTPTVGKNVKNDYMLGSDFRLVFYGSAINPSVIIDGHTYRVNKTLLEGERVEIDSVSKTIKIYGIDGTIQNGFQYRYKPESIFEKIPFGTKKLSWSGDFRFDITLIDSRSEPPWKWTEVSAEDVEDIVEKDDKYYLLDSNGDYILDSDGEIISVSGSGGE